MSHLQHSVAVTLSVVINLIWFMNDKLFNVKLS